MGEVEDAGSIFDATETPVADVLRYAVAYPLVIALAAVGVAVGWPDVWLNAAGGLLVVMLVTCAATAWMIRPRKRADIHVGGGRAVREEGMEPSYVLTDDAGQRFRVLAFGVGTVLWGLGGLVAILWGLPAMRLV